MNPGLPEEETFPLPVGTMTIGRTKDNDVHCLHKSLSRKHAKIEFDGHNVRVTDLHSKNGLFFKGKRVDKCELGDGDSFRCGDISFLIESATARHPKISAVAQTLPSPLALEASVSRRITRIASPAVLVEDEGRYKDKLFALIRASELLVSELSLEKFLDELVVLAVQVIEVDRIALLVLDDESLEMKPRVVKSFVKASSPPFSKRVVDWVVDHGSPASFANVSTDKSLAGDLRADARVKGAMGVPINAGGGTIGVLYADSLSEADCFRPDDLALVRALANVAAVALESDALRRSDRRAAAGD